MVAIEASAASASIGVEFIDSGAHERKGVRDGWALYQAT